MTNLPAIDQAAQEMEQQLAPPAQSDVERLMAKPVCHLAPAEILAGKPLSYVTDDGGIITYDLATLKAIQGESFVYAKDAEIAAFIAYCQVNHLNPLARECFFVKYREKDPPAFITVWEVFLRRANRHPAYDGYEDGVLWRIADAQGLRTVRGRPCDYAPDDGHVVVGGWCRVYRKDRSHPVDVEVPMEEMLTTRFDYESKTRVPNQTWGKMPTTMATKTPRCRALRAAFPEDLAEMYTEDEAEALRAALVAPPTPAPEPAAEAPKLPTRRETQKANGNGTPQVAPQGDAGAIAEMSKRAKPLWWAAKQAVAEMPVPARGSPEAAALANEFRAFCEAVVEKPIVQWTKDDVATVVADLREHNNPLPPSCRNTTSAPTEQPDTTDDGDDGNEAGNLF